MVRFRAGMIGLILSCTPMAALADEAAEARRLAKATLEAAKEGLKNQQSAFGVSDLYWWSQRILFAELELSETPPARLTAFKAT